MPPFANTVHATKLGPYRLLRRIGAGGMGVVYEAEHVSLGIRRALKVFNLSGDSSAGFRERFLSEGRLLARLSHPGLVKVYDLEWDENGGSPWYAMDLVLDDDGEPHTLADLTPGEADEEQVAKWFSSIADTIGYIHSQGVIHRDIKPGNILVAADGRLVLSDFGISRIVREELRLDVGAEMTCTNITATGRPAPVSGTSGFIAPEVLAGKPASIASDIYSIGVVFFRLLTGVWYDNSLAPGSAATNATGIDSAALLNNLEYNWAEILPPMLAANPAERPTDIGAIAASLQTNDCNAHKITRRRFNIWKWAAALAVCTAAVAGTLVFTNRNSKRNASIPSFDDVYAIPESIK